MDGNYAKKGLLHAPAGGSVARDGPASPPGETREWGDRRGTRPAERSVEGLQASRRRARIRGGSDSRGSCRRILGAVCRDAPRPRGRVGRITQAGRAPEEPPEPHATHRKRREGAPAG